MSTTSEWGYWRVSVDGHDVTMLRDAPARISYQMLEPFGCGPGTLACPALSPLEDLGGVLGGAFHYGAIVNVWRFLPGGGRERMWSGSLGQRKRGITSTQGRIEWRLIGDMEEAGNQNWQPPMAMEPTDIGTVIASALNGVVGRRYHALTQVTTGILTTNRGSADQTVLAYVQDLLAGATTDDGTSQWTVRRVPNSLDYEIVLKDRDTVQWNVTAGGFGVQPSIMLDEVPTRWFGNGVTKDGGWWGNWRYPGASADTAPDYPNSSPSAVLGLGDSDADTSSGTGVSDLQERINDLNLTGNVAVDGTLGPKDIAAIKEIQEHYGLSVDGVVGPQTWTATFNVGGGATLGTPRRLPLAWHPRALPRLYAADGSDAGANPLYDPSDSPPVIDIDISLGPGVSRAEGRRSVRAMYARDWPPGHLGDLTLSGDPEEGSRFEIQPGDNIRIRGLGGGNPTFHVTAAQVNCDRDVTLAVDQKARDLLSQVAIRQRKKQNATNPARIPKNARTRRATLTPDAVVPFDAESPAGRIPRFAVYAGLWSVIHIPVSQAGVFGKVIMESSPDTKWAMAFFGAPVKPSDLLGWVGNPFGDDAPWDEHQDDMEDAGLIECWGSSEDACGLKRNGDVSGKFKDQANITYRSLRPPWMWIAVYAPTATFLKGRVYPAPMDA